MPKENHTSLINAHHKLVITLNGQVYDLLGRNAQIARALITANYEPCTPNQLIEAMGLQPSSSSHNSPERLALYQHINQLRKRFPSLLYCLNSGRGWRINRDFRPRIMFYSCHADQDA